MITLDIIIINWNSGRQLYDCLKSIENSSKEGFTLNNTIVVDNNSSDNSLENLEALDIPLNIIKNKVNRGFGAACNQGARLSSADYLLFLNPDTILYVDSLSKPLKFMDKDENFDVGVCGIKLINENGMAQRSCCIFPTTKHFISRSSGLNQLFPKFFPTYFLSNWNHEDTRSVDHVIGAFYLIRNDLFRQLKGFDERFFVYLEDLDLSLRINKIKKKVIYLSDVQAFHKGGGTSEQVKAKRLFYSLRSRILYIFKHFSIVQCILLFLITMFIEPLSRIAFLMLKRSLRDANEVFNAYLLLWKDMPNIWRSFR